MRIENELLARFQAKNVSEGFITTENPISTELDFFFNNVMDTVVEYFNEKEFSKV